ncbi:F-box protein At4g22280-like [Vicia villosa]|uniref:F-box protein At4g22280-like n=1 Tax=Vicia villosa TaxID=3911 RepID=UPI00273A992D|nr:F-box protein At4g22280-like [Vicia villosa]XP_058730957.1 F-box protein At4g22280-like [Vicia villosa]
MKKRRPSENENEETDENEDRLSDLPDCIILHILSFLNTKHVVQTCVLSTRWKHLWKCIPTLILHSSRFTSLKKFDTFVSNIFILRDSSTELHAFDLDIEHRGNIEPQLLKKIANYVSSHDTHLRDLGISLRGDISLIFSCVSSCRALTSLRLKAYPRVNDNVYAETLFPKSLNLPLLTSLDLTNFDFCGGENCHEPFLAYTKLNSLVLRSCRIGGNAQFFSISSDTLVNLALHSNSYAVIQIKLSTPNLCTFEFTGDIIPKLCEGGLSSVKQVNIDSQNILACSGDALILFSWLLDLSNVESLTVTSTILQILSLVPAMLEVKLPSLYNLKSLKVELIPLDDGLLRLLMKENMLKKAAAKSSKEVFKLKKAFKARLEPPAIPDGIVDFLRQNSPSAEVNITTNYPSSFNLKQVEESIKGAKIIKYCSRFSVPSSSVASASAAKSAF